MTSKLVGTRVKRSEDRRLITGRAAYVDDIRLPGMLHMEVLRSTHAHAHIQHIDVRKVVDLPGVVAVLTGQEVHHLTPPLPAPIGLPNLKVPKHYLLAVDNVCYLGEGVAAVVAADRYVARDALDLIEVAYDPLPAVVDPERAMEPGTPLVHEDFEDNIAYRLPMGPDIDDALRKADVVIRQRMENQRLIPSPMETRGIVASYEPGEGHLTVWLSTQGPHLMRSQLADLLNIPEHKLRVVAPEVGGAFGCKLNPYADEILAAALAVRLGKPVKWIEDRQEHMVVTNHGRGQVAYLEAGAKRDGTVTALRVRIIADLGAHHHGMTPMAPLQTAQLITGCYRIPIATADVIGVFTNKTPMDPYRGFGRAEAAYYIERTMDLVAQELNLDPVVIRRQNFIQPDQFPYTGPLGHVYDSGNYDLTLSRGLEVLDYPQFRRDQQRLRQEGRYIGVGFATYVWRAGFPSVAVPPGFRFLKGGWESATVRVEPMGTVTILTGTSPHGQGGETTFAQMAADELGVPIEGVRVIHGDTDAVQYGMGSMGSRGMAVGGSAVLLSLQKVRKKAIQIAAHSMGASIEDIVFEQGHIGVAGSRDRTMSLQDVADLAYHGGNLPSGMEPGLEATSRFNPTNFTSPFGTHVCVVEVDTNTGQVEIQRYIAVDDCGRVINPSVVEGQIHGGIAQGVGQALLEEAVYDQNGQLLTGSFLDYLIPTSSELPLIQVDRTETPTPVNPLGAKGVGEAGTMGAPAAVVNAVLDALSPFNIRHIDMPLSPEKVWRAIAATLEAPAHVRCP
jgi:carbon-monoxide dehydrogenase large subunit